MMATRNVEENVPEAPPLCVVTFNYLHKTDSALKFMRTYLSPINVCFRENVSIEQGCHPYGKLINVVETEILSTGTLSEKELESVMLTSWCKWQGQDEEPFGWLTLNAKTPQTYLMDHISNTTDIKYAGIGFGSLKSPSQFCHHWPTFSDFTDEATVFSSQWPIDQCSASIHFEHDCDYLTISDYKQTHLDIKFELSTKTFNKRIIVCNEDRTTSMYFETTERFKLSVKYRGDTSHAIRWIPNDGRKEFGLSTVLKVTFPNTEENTESKIQIIARYKRRKFEVTYACVKTTQGNNLEDICGAVKFKNFETEYAWQCLLHRGYNIIDSITPEIKQHLVRYQRQDISWTFYNMEEKVQENIFFDFTFHWNRSAEEKQENDHDAFPASELYVRKIIVTPTTEMYLKKEPIKQNRVILQHDPDYFIRIVFKDEDFGKLCLSARVNPHPLIDRIKTFMRDGVRIGDRHYEFLGCSNSQMREHGVWFCASHNGVTADDIRDSLGDFKKERCVALYVARLGLCFSASCKSVLVERNRVYLEEDIRRNGYCFTDGIGKISIALAKRVSKELGIGPPSAFQIRYAGCKGVVAVDPSLKKGKEEDVLVVRDSMHKFESSSNTLEILQWTCPGQLFLNRQIITLLSGLGVRDEVFLLLQQKMLINLTNMLLFEEPALKALSTVLEGIDFKKLKEKVLVTKEPFFRSILINIYKKRINDLMYKSRIEIPWSDGRIMMGTVDETGTLKSGQVFIAYSEYPTEEIHNVLVHQGKVVVAKNPCFHPGDIRKFDAVNVLALQHMVDCIVFPQNGERPHPDEMSGSDLDGDMYFVCWAKPLVPPNGNEVPMDFPKSEKKVLDRSVEIDDVIEFLGDYILQDRLGLIANAHVVHADLKDIKCVECIALARMHSEAVDFPKTGKLPQLRDDLIVEKYPDFMMKKGKVTYRSEKVLGKLFQENSSVFRSFCWLSDSFQIFGNFSPNQAFKHALHSYYVNDAMVSYKKYREKLSDLMNLYGIKTEAEIVTGLIISMNIQRGNERDRFEIAKIIQSKMAKIRDETRMEFFKEFGGETKATAGSEREKVMAKGSAWYDVAYNSKSSDFNCLSFPWVVSEIIISLTTYKEKQPSTALLDIGSSVERHISQTYERRRDTFDSLLSFSKRFLSLTDICRHRNVFVVGVFSLGLMSSDDKTLTLYVDKDMFRRMCEVFDCDSRKTEIILYQEPYSSFRVIMSTDQILLKQTALIQTAIERYPNSVVYFSYILDWARVNDLLGSSQRHICDELTFAYLATRIIFPDLTQDDACMIPTLSTINDITFPQTTKLRNTRVKEKVAEYILYFLSRLVNDLLEPEKLTQSPCQLTVDNASRIIIDICTAIQELALYQSLDTLEDEEYMEDSMELPFDIWESVFRAEPFIAHSLMEQTNLPYIDIRQTNFGVLLESYGTYGQTKELRHLITHLALHSSRFITTASRDLVANCFACVFEGCTGEDDLLKFSRYEGPYNAQHEHNTLKIPELVSPISFNSFGIDYEMFRAVCLKQIETINDDFDTIFHGEISLHITLGKFYVVNGPGEHLSVGDFTNALRTHCKQAETLKNSGNVYRNRKPRNKTNTMMKQSFMPTNCNKSNILSVLRDKGFKLQDTTKYYQANINLNSLEAQKGTLSLDKDFKFKEFRFTDRSWLVADLIRKQEKQKPGLSSDIRFKIRSFRKLDKKYMQKDNDLKTLLTANVIQKYRTEGIEIDDSFKDRIHYVREKTVQSFRNPDITSIRVEILLTSVKEYFDPNKNGKHFVNPVTRDEIAIIPEIPRWSEKKEWELFLEKIWRFSLSFAKTVDETSSL